MSDFWADLQAWTQAQFERLVRINLRRRKQWSADDINRLLRDRVAKRLTIKLGKRVPPEFLRTNGRWPPDLPPIPCEMLSGWLAYHYGPDTTGLEWLYERQDSGDIDGPISDPAFNGVRFGTSRCNENLTGTDGMIANKGLCYSGRMRELVQMLGGKTQQIPYNYQWCQTHGVFINQITGAWWIVEISQTDGIRAVPVVWCQTYTEEEQLALGVTIPGIPAVAAVGGIGTRSLGSASDAYAGAWPIYSEHGWAFSYTGHHAALIAITWPGDYQRSTVWQVEIQTDNNGDPLSAQVSELEHAIVWGSKAYAPKFPYFSTCGPTLLSLLMLYDLPDGVPAPDTNDIPMDVFYPSTGGSVPIISRYHTDPGSSVVTMAPNWPTATPTACTRILLDAGANGHYYVNAWTREEYGTIHYQFDGVGRPEAEEMQYKEATDGTVVDSEVHKTGGWCVTGGVPAVRKVWQERWDGSANYYSDVEDVLTKNETLFKPFFDREMIGLYRKKQLGRTSSTVFHTATEWIVGGEFTYYGWSSENPPNAPCGNAQLYYLYAYPDRCVADWSVWIQPNTGLHFSSIGVTDITEWEPVPLVTGDDDCPIQWRMEGCAVGSHGNSSCGVSFSPGYAGEIVDKNTATWLWNNAASRWEPVYDEDEYSSFDAMTDWVDDPCAGNLLFCSYIDAFTGWGLTFKHLNWTSGESMYKIGNVDAYPVEDGTRGVFDGWFGIPFPPP